MYMFLLLCGAFYSCVEYPTAVWSIRSVAVPSLLAKPLGPYSPRKSVKRLSEQIGTLLMTEEHQRTPREFPITELIMDHAVVQWGAHYGSPAVIEKHQELYKGGRELQLCHPLLSPPEPPSPTHRTLDSPAVSY